MRDWSDSGDAKYESINHTSIGSMMSHTSLILLRWCILCGRRLGREEQE